MSETEDVIDDIPTRSGVQPRDSMLPRTLRSEPISRRLTYLVLRLHHASDADDEWLYCDEIADMMSSAYTTTYTALRALEEDLDIVESQPALHNGGRLWRLREAYR